MSASTSRLAYRDAEEVFDAAIADGRGIRIPFSDKGDALHMRLRLHKFRQLDRDDNARTFDRGHPLYGRSNYDVIRVRVVDIDDVWYLYLEPINNAGQLTIERLSEIEEEEPVTIRRI